MPSAWLLAVLLAGSARASEEPLGPGWRETLTPHFRLAHQEPWLPNGLTIGIERINFRLRMDLGMFQNWSSAGRTNIYLYRDLQSYVHGEFSPPPWSNGVAIYEKKAVAVPAMKQTAQILRVLAHENTHLVFVNYFREKHRDPPSWVNEGLAMLEEAESPTSPETSQWYQNMVEMSPGAWFPMDDFLRLSPTKDLGDDKSKVAVFYVQAYSVTHFLVRKHSHLQFKAFCDYLRDGRPADEALRLAYHYRSTADFEKRWRAWLNDPTHKKRVVSLKLEQRATGDGVIDQAGHGNSTFQPFSTGWGVQPRVPFAKPSASPGGGAAAVDGQ